MPVDLNSSIFAKMGTIYTRVTSGIKLVLPCLHAIQIISGKVPEMMSLLAMIPTQAGLTQKGRSR